MNTPSFIETIKVLDGQFINLPYHYERMSRTIASFFNMPISIDLRPDDIPVDLRTGLVKCRVVYSSNNTSVEYTRYAFRKVESLRLIEDNEIDYSYKYEDRSSLLSLLSRKENCDDILIVKNGYITDTSYSNVVLENASGLYTPSSYLLSGTKRRLLLDRGRIKETDIRVSDLHHYSKLYLINSMIDVEDNISLTLSQVI